MRQRGYCYDLFYDLSVPPKFICWNLQVQVILRIGVLGDDWRQSPHGPRETSSPLLHVGLEWEDAIYEELDLTGHQICSCLGFELLSSRTVRTTFLLFVGYPVDGIFVIAPQIDNSSIKIWVSSEMSKNIFPLSFELECFSTLHFNPKQEKSGAVWYSGSEGWLW